MASSHWLRLLNFSTLFCIYASLILVQTGASENESFSEKLLVITVASDKTDGFLRFNRSAEKYGISVRVLGMGEEWRGGDIKKYAGGGYKVNLLKKNLAKYANSKDLVVMFVDSYDVVFTADPNTILETFYGTNSRILFSSEVYCWPDQSLAPQYPKGETGMNKYLNSGGFDIPGFIGYAPEIMEMISSFTVGDLDDDQLFYTKVYLDEELREKWQIKLDHRSQMFQCLNGASKEMELEFSEDDAYLKNIAYNTHPLVIHGNGQSKLLLDSYSNYLAKSWHPEKGYMSCDSEKDLGKEEDLPSLILAIFLRRPTPFFREFLQRIAALNYPKNKLHLFFYYSTNYHSKDVDAFLKEYQDQYKSKEIVSPKEAATENVARDKAIKHCQDVKCEYLFSVDSGTMFTNPDVLQLLMKQNKKIIAPMMVRPFKLWSNFWGALTSDGYYSRSFDYVDIVQGDKKGTWNVPFISTTYLIDGSLINSDEFDLNYESEEMELDLIFSSYMRENGIFMYVTNLHNYGHLIDSDKMQVDKVHPDLYQLFDNRIDWEARYIHENYSHYLENTSKIEEPCPDVFWFPIVSETFCDQIIEELLAFGKWSDGSNSDPRLANGYENVPTRDIHMNQIGFERQWLHFLKEFVSPLQERIYPGYHSDPPHALLNFVVRYRADEQPSLRPHHDTSTYTINIALNRPGIDFQGGGCRFVRYNCSVTQTRKGWSFIHPGRLTHLHEGLPTTGGTRYIFVTFVDP